MKPEMHNRRGAAAGSIMILFAVMLPFVLKQNTATSASLRSAASASDVYALYFPVVFGEAPHVFVPAGTFQMGCDAAHNGGFLCFNYELPVHQVYLDDYYIDRIEVTNGQYEACVTAGACEAPAYIFSNYRPFYYGNPTFSDYPVIYVNWFQAKAFCDWSGSRLPTEAEWEKAARGAIDTRAYPWGNTVPTCALVNSTNLGISCIGDTSKAGSYSPAGDSQYGVQDIAGNVYEWVNDWYSSTYYQGSPQNNPPGPASGTLKVRRGGAYGSYGNYLRVAARISNYPSLSLNYIGFRCARDP